MKTHSSLLIVLFVLLSNLVSAQEKYSTVRIYAPADKTQRADLIGLLQIDHFQSGEGNTIIAELSTRDMNRLKRTPYTFDILVDDVAGKLAVANRQYYKDKADGKTQNRLALQQTGKTVDDIIPTPAAFEVKSTFGGYYSFAEMEAAMNTLVSRYSSIASKTSLGKTSGNRDIWCIKISDQVSTDDPNEPEVLYMGLQHAREAIGGSSMIFFMQYLCENYTTDPNIKDLVDNREIFIVPCFNPDGWEYNRLNGGVGAGWRKNRRSNGDGTFGVDLNRNWGVDWGNCSRPIVGSPSSCGTNNTDDDTYYGPSAFSENETKAIRDFTYAHHLVAMIDQHSYGPYYSLPFGRPSLPTNTMTRDDSRFYTYISAAMGTYNGMRAGNSPQALGYEVAGGVKDWMLKGNIGTGTKGTVRGLTGEGGAGGGTSGSFGSFWAPASEIENLCKGMVFQNLQLLYAAGSYVDLQDKSDMSIILKNGSFDFRALRVGLENQPVVVSIVPIENIQSVGSPLIITELDNYYETYDGSINYTLPAALTNGQRIRFAWKIETGGYKYYDTVTKFYNPIELLYDDMEGNFATNWNSTAVNGNSGVTEENWSFTSIDKYAGTKSMTESASGNYLSRTTRTVTYNNTLDLDDATSAYLSFWTKYHAENFRDKLRVQVSTNGTSWVSIAGTNTIQEPGTLDGSTINGIPSLTGIRPEWTRELFDLSAWLGTPALRLRFVFTSDATTSFDFSEDDGFYIDNLKVIKTTAAQVTLPVHFISFTGRLLADQTVRLDWNAETDDQHDYFEVERSTDGNNFTSIGRGPSSAPYWKIDPSPATGDNFYRIKQVDKNGMISYSTIISVNYNPPFIIAAYPNPVTDVLNIKVNTKIADMYTISVTDATGRQIHEEKVVAGGGDMIRVNLKQYTSQFYILVIKNSRQETVSTLKIAKQS